MQTPSLSSEYFKALLAGVKAKRELGFDLASLSPRETGLPFVVFVKQLAAPRARLHLAWRPVPRDVARSRPADAALTIMESREKPVDTLADAEEDRVYHVYQLPFGKGHALFNHGAAAWILGGFQISGTLSRYSGLPFTVSASSASLNAAGQSQTADQINAQVKILGGHDPNTPYFDGTAFAPITTARLGSTGRNILFGPGVFTMSQSISRTFTFKEKVKLEFLGEAFNLTNHPNFSNPGGTFAAPTMNPDGSVKSYGNYSVISSVLTTQGVGPRQLQVGAYIRF